MLKCTGVL